MLFLSFWFFRLTAPALVTFCTLFGFFEAVGLALDRDDFGAMHEPIGKPDDAPCAGENLLPLGERLVGGNDSALLFVAPVDQFEEQVRVAIGVREVPDFIDGED